MRVVLTIDTTGPDLLKHFLGILAGLSFTRDGGFGCYPVVPILPERRPYRCQELNTSDFPISNDKILSGAVSVYGHL